MNINILCVGKIKEKYLRDACSEYSKRLGKYCKLNIIEVDDEKTPDKASAAEELIILSKEGDRLRRKLPKDTELISMAIEGERYDSVAFANMLQSRMNKGVSNITFVIGGSLGIDSTIKKDSAQLISFSDMTFPHQLMRVMLLEQVYRSFRILSGEPYHK